MTTSAQRPAIDFDAFERDLRQASQPQPESQAPSRGDPLAELARIVGQDDPFRALLASQGKSSARAAAASSPGSRIEPAFYDAAPASADAAAQHSPADAFDQYLATVEQGSYAEDDEHARNEAAAFDEAPKGYRAFIAGRPRKQVVQVGAGLGVLMLCVTGALGWKFTHSHGSSGGPVTVLADKTPLKVAPQAADGLEVPDQKKQIYERNVKDGQIKVVNREEQPIDVSQAAKSAGRDTGSTTPGNTAMLTDSLGEPRRVRTVSVKPDTPVTAASQAQASGQPQRVASADPADHASASPIPTMTMPVASEAAPSQTPTAPPRRPARTLASTTTAEKPVQTADASGAIPASTPASMPEPAAAPAPAPRKSVQRVAAVAPETTASTDAAPAAAPASTASVGGFSVQIGVRASDADARSAFRQMQGKYSQLSGKPELIQQAEVGGKSIYRVRVGPLAKNDATSLCTELKGAGGQCFVAKN